MFRQCGHLSGKLLGETHEITTSLDLSGMDWAFQAGKIPSLLFEIKMAIERLYGRGFTVNGFTMWGIRATFGKK